SKVDMDQRELVFIRVDPPALTEFSMLEKPGSLPHTPSYYRGGSIDAELETILRSTGGVVNLSRMIEAIEQYISGDLLETELGQALRKLWPRNR
ncbi:unnamed protein product, partial [marine sediment metagenome]